MTHERPTVDRGKRVEHFWKSLIDQRFIAMISTRIRIPAEIRIENDVATTQATLFLKARKADFDTLEYEHDPRAEAFGLEAVEKLGLDRATVFKTLVVSDEASPAKHALALVPAAEKLSFPAVAKALNWKRAAMAKPADAQRLTGYVLGGISAFGTKRPLPVIVDASMLTHPLIHVSGGKRGLEVRLKPQVLVDLLQAVAVDICA